MNNPTHPDKATGDDEPNYIKCVHNAQRGLLTSNPPQYMCEYCNGTWMYGTPAPTCPVLKSVSAQAVRAALEAVIDYTHGLPQNEPMHYLIGYIEADIARLNTQKNKVTG